MARCLFSINQDPNPGLLTAVFEVIRLSVVFHQFQNQLLDFSSNRIKSSGDYFMSSATYVYTRNSTLCCIFQTVTVISNIVMLK